MTADILVIGFGNTLRGDDGIGPTVAMEVEEQRLPGVRALAVHQLTPELAADLADARFCVFVDAAVSGEPVTTVRLDGSKSPLSAMTHVVDPRGLLALACAVYDCSTETWLVTAAGVEFGYQEGLSPTGRENAHAAARQVVHLIREAQLHEAGLAQAALEIAKKHADKCGATCILRLTLQVGDLSGVAPEALRLSLEAQSPGTIAEGAAFEIEVVPVECYCPTCDTIFRPMDVVYACLECGAISADVRTGHELVLRSMEVA